MNSAALKRGMPPLVTLVLLLLGIGVLARAAPTSVDLQVEHIGVPFPSWSSPVYSHATAYIQSPHLTRYTHLAPRFHRLLRYGSDINSKTQTAIFVAGRSADHEEQGRPGASVLSALNPRNGGIVWRVVRNDTDPMHSMHLASDVLFTISGLDELRGSMHHALTGQLLWTTTMPGLDGARRNGLVDVALLPPPSEIKAGPSIAATAPDVIAMDRAGRVFRFAGINGAVIWLNDPAKNDPDSTEAPMAIKVHSTLSHTFVISLIPHQPKMRLFSSTGTYSLRITVLSASTGARLGTFDVPNSNVEMSSAFAVPDNTAGNVFVVGQDGNPSKGVDAKLVWLQNDGSIRSLALPFPDPQDEVEIDSSAIQVIKTKAANRYVSLIEVPNLSNRGIMVANTDAGTSEALKIMSRKQELKSFWHFEEDARDAIYSGTIDRKDKAYINRMYFSSGQHLLNLHVLWTDAHNGEGQVTGFSFQWDHDLNGDVLAAPFEASQVSEFQLVTRAALVTASSSIRMIQEERHQWIREEGLSHTTATVLIDLPESRIGAGATPHSSGLDPTILLGKGEGYAHRLERHLTALQYAPQYIVDTLWEAAKELPGLGLHSFGINSLQVQSSLQRAEGGEDKSPKATSSAFKSYGAAPLGGVGAQNVARGPPPPGVPPTNSRRVKSPLPNEGPPPPAALAPRLANETIARNLVRDDFGFRKLIVATSKKGKIYALDGQTGEYLWEKSLIGFGKGEGAVPPNVTVRLLALVRSAGGSGVDVGASTQKQVGGEALHTDASQLKYNALLTVVADVEEEGVVVTRMWEIEPLTGVFPSGVESQTGLALFPGRAKDSFLLPIEDEENGQIAAAIVDRNDKFYVWPTSPSVARQFTELRPNFFYAIEEKSQGKTGQQRSILVGYSPVVSSAEVKGERVWQLPLTTDEEEVTAIARPTQDVIASQGKVLGNRKTMYKYLNPHALVVTTRNKVTGSAQALVIDGITGRIMHEATLCEGGLARNNVDGTEAKMHVVFTENWVTIAFEVDVAADDPLAKYKGAHRQTRLVSIELYEVQGKDETWKWKGQMSSFAGGGGATTGVHSSALQVFSQVYVLPGPVRGLSSTRTKYGISSKAILLATGRGKLMALPRRLLDPRRPHGRKPTSEELEEGLSTYDPYIPDNAKLYVANGKVTPIASHMRTRASMLESLSVVLVYGSLDWWVTKVAPSGSFDLLSESFNKPQLLLTIVALSVGLLITKPMVASKTLRSRW